MLQIKLNLSKARRLVGGGLTFAFLASSFIPSGTGLFAPDQSSLATAESKIESKTELKTKPGVQIPVEFIYLSQGFWAFHPGVDLAGELGASVKPIMSGVVSEIQHSTFSYGNAIIVDHGNGITSLYAHLSKIEVKVGQKVDLDTEIGKMGSTGHSTGPHLHLEVRDHNFPINPLSVLPPISSLR